MRVKQSNLLEKLSVLSISFITIYVIAFSASASLGVHSAILDLDPKISKGNTLVNFSLTVTNNISSDNAIKGVTVKVPLDGESCAIYDVKFELIKDPVSWGHITVNDGCEDSRIKEIVWATSVPENQISRGSSKTFNFAAVTPGIGGIYTWSVVTTDSAGGTQTNKANHTVDVKPPSVVIKNPTANNWFKGTITVVHNESDDVGLSLCTFDANIGPLAFGKSIVPITCNSPFDFDTNRCNDEEGIDNGCTIKITAIDLAGNMNSSSVTFFVDNSPPFISEVTVKPPAVNPDVNNKITIESDGFDPQGLKSCTARLAFPNGTTIQSFGNLGKDCDGERNVSKVVSDGEYIIEVTAKNNVDDTASASTKFFVDRVPPNLAEITSPANNSLVGGVVKIKAKAEDQLSGIERVDFFVDGGLIGSDNSNDFEFDWDTTGVEPGLHELFVTAFDLAGNKNKSASIFVNVDSVPPALESAVTTSKTTINVTFSEELDPATLNASHFNVSGFAIVSANLFKNVVILTVSEMPTDATPDITYTKGTLADLAGNLVPTGMVQAKDGVPPEMVLAVTINVFRIDVFFSEDLDEESVSKTDFIVMNGNIPIGVASVEKDNSRVTLNIANAISVDDTPTINLTGDGVKDLAGNVQKSGSVTAMDGIAPEIESITITLHKNWNFISVPKQLEKPNVADALKDVNYDMLITFDPVNGWTIPITIQPLVGYWIKVNTPTVITLNFTQVQLPPSRSLAIGWNSIGTTFDQKLNAETSLVSVDADYSHIIAWDVIKQVFRPPIINNVKTCPPPTVCTKNFDLIPGEGYWLATIHQTMFMSLTA